MESAKLFLACMLIFALIESTCGVCLTLETDTAQCFTSQGFPAPLPGTSSAGVAPVIGQTDWFGADICTTRRSQYTAAIRCMLQAFEDCIDLDIVVAVPSPDQADDLVTFACQQSCHVNYDCINRQVVSQDVLKCISDEIATNAPNMATASPTQIQCASLDTTIRCAAPAIQNSCGCAEAHYQSAFFTGSLRPKVCGPATFDPVTCDGGIGTECSGNGDNGGTVFSARPYMLSLSLIPVMFRFCMA